MKRWAVLAIVTLFVLHAPLAALATDGARPSQVYFTRVAELSQQYGEYAVWPLAAKRAWIEARIAYGEDRRTYGEIDGEDIQAMQALLALDNDAQGAAIDQYLLDTYGDGELCDDLERQPFTVLYECCVTGGGRVMSPRDYAYTPSPAEQAAEQRPIAENIRQAVMDHLTEVGEFPQELLRDVGMEAVWDEQEGRYTVTASIDKDLYLAAKRSPDQLSSFDLDAGGFVKGDTLCFQIAKTERMVHAFDWRASNAMKEKEDAWIAELWKLLTEAGVSDTLYNQQDQFFWTWTPEEKAAWSQTARPVVQKYLTEHDEFARYLDDVLDNRYQQRDWPLLIVLTQYLYGVPDERALSQEQAYQIARDAAIQRGAKQSYVDDNKHHIFFYDVTDPARPTWKVHINMLFGAADTEHPYDATAPRGYFAVIDAYSGEILQITERTVNTDMRELV